MEAFCLSLGELANLQKGLEKAEFCFKVLHIVKIGHRQRAAFFAGFSLFLQLHQMKLRMGFLELILKRQSTRKYLDRKVDRTLVEKCLEAARLAPSACNSQPWHFVVVDDCAKTREIGDAAAGLGMNRFASSVPVIVAVVLEKMNFTAKVGSMLKNKDYCMLDLGIAVEHFCLQATEEGLGTCILGWFDEKKVARLLGVPASKRIPLLITVGYPDCGIRDKVRKPIEEISSWNSY